jgi:hypothetical protein
MHVNNTPLTAAALLQSTQAAVTGATAAQKRWCSGQGSPCGQLTEQVSRPVSLMQTHSPQPAAHHQPPEEQQQQQQPAAAERLVRIRLAGMCTLRYHSTCPCGTLYMPLLWVRHNAGPTR